MQKWTKINLNSRELNRLQLPCRNIRFDIVYQSVYLCNSPFILLSWYNTIHNKAYFVCQSSVSLSFSISRTKCYVRVASCKRFLCFVSVSRRGQRSIIMSATASPLGVSDSFTCTPLSLWISPSPSPCVSLSLPGFRRRGARRWWVSQMELKCLVPQLSPMQIALSTDSIAENSQQSVLFDAFFLFIFCHDVIICGTAAPLVNVSDSRLLISLSLYFAAGLPSLLRGLLQYLQHSDTVSVFVLLGSCSEATCLLKTLVIRENV